MVELATFKKILSSAVTLKPLTNGLLQNVKQDLRGWSATLSMKSESEQCRELEKLLSELLVAEVADKDRIEMMQNIYPNVERLIGQLHQHYIYDASVITPKQQVYLNQVKSLYYLSILVYRGVIDRELIARSDPQKSPLAKLKLKRSQLYSAELMVSIYRVCNIYLHLFMEQSVTYQKSPELYWGEMNFLYKIAFLGGFYATDLQKYLAADTSTTIQDIYRQACLHSLLGLSSYRRQDIVGVHKLLPEWAKQVTLTEEATSELRLFVDLNGTYPPMHLTPYAKVNPYEPDKLCLFLDLSSFESYLANIIKESENSTKVSIHLRLGKMAWHTLNTKSERHEQRRLVQDKATVVSGFSLIHYYMAGKKPFSSLIRRQSLERPHLPKYDTKPKDGYSKNNLKVDVLDTSTTGCRFEWEVSEQKEEETMDGVSLRVLSLFVIQRHPADKKTIGKVEDGQWQVGIVRWIECHGNKVEAGSRIIANSATACGVRLDNKDNRSQDFVPALLLAGDEKLGSKTTLLVPYYHFRLNDKVVLRIGEEQTLLRLQRLLINSDDFEQYEIVRIG